MKKVLFLHGRGGDGQENWFSWLKKELETRGFQVFNPELPNTDNPKLREQVDFISNYYEKIGKVDYIVGHSLGCLTAIHLIEKFDISSVNCIFVGPAYKGITEEVGKNSLGDVYRNLKEYFDSVVLYKKLGNRYTIFLSDNDPYIKVDSAKNYYSKIENVKFLVFHNMGHFNEGASIKKLPEILDYLS
ncbi:alpha/beta fold hydrolase [Candidatus Gracilibacteria bacterium]|nr:alpha/beta fold hydrolase [Candidatus Gracilibacteria bacterium]